MPKRRHKGKKKSSSNKRGRWHAPLATESVGFRQYYQAQGNLFTDDWSLFETTLHKPLPTVFRINAALPKAASDRIKEKMKGDFYNVFVEEQH